MVLAQNQATFVPHKLLRRTRGARKLSFCYTTSLSPSSLLSLENGSYEQVLFISNFLYPQPYYPYQYQYLNNKYVFLIHNFSSPFVVAASGKRFLRAERDAPLEKPKKNHPLQILSKVHHCCHGNRHVKGREGHL